MIRKIIHIDEEKCNGCGACVTACHEGAIGLVNGKAKLMRDDYCDGFGDCPPTTSRPCWKTSRKRRHRPQNRPSTAARAAPCASSAGRKAHLLPPPQHSRRSCASGPARSSWCR